MGIYEELKARGLIAQVTDEEQIRDLVNNGKATFYIGFDPTADSLHIGHFMPLCLMKRIGRKGLFYRVALHAEQNIEDGYVAVSGHLTAMVGREGLAVTVMRPSGKVRIDADDYDAISYHNTYLEAGTPVKVVKVENMQLYVVPLNPDKP